MLCGGMKLPDIYRDWRVVTGIALLFLGAGNWWVGLTRAQQASQIIAQAANVIPSTDYRSFDEIESGDNGAVLKPLNPQGERLSYARARMDFYHAAFMAGQVILVVGVFITLWGFIGIIRRDTGRTLKNLSPTLNGHDSGAG